MNDQRAKKLIIECVKKEIHSLGVAANLQDMFNANLPHTVQASQRRKELQEVLELVERKFKKPVQEKLL